MHTIWKGSISFGLVNIPVKMYSATEDKDISMKYLHKECGSTLSNSRTCTTCESEVEWADVIRGYEYEKGKYVTFSKEELDLLSGDKNKTINIMDFVSANEIDPIYYQKTYYLGPDEIGANAYYLLHHALSTTNKIGIANVSIRSKQTLAVVRHKLNCLLLETVHFPDEIRNIEHVPNLLSTSPIQFTKKEIDLAIKLVDHLSSSFVPPVSE